VFSLFLGMALSVPAFPVLARILSDRGMQRSELGVLALPCAAVEDVTAWCLLALVAQAQPERAQDERGQLTQNGVAVRGVPAGRGDSARVPGGEADEGKIGGRGAGAAAARIFCGDRAANWMVCGVIIVLASAGKFGGSYVSARATATILHLLRGGTKSMV
jgi:hypothetical protein